MADPTEMRSSHDREIDEETIRLPKALAEPQVVKTRPANENRPGTAMMLARLRRRPSFTPYGLIATIITALWSGGWYFDFAPSLGAAAPNDSKYQVLALLIVPVVVWPAAYMLWRAADMRKVSEAMLQSAMQLVQPQDIATEGLTTIAQAVRSDVDLLVGGVENAVQRATVLEEIVHKEIAAIKRAFEGNEERIHSLVSSIETQRSALHQATLLISGDTDPLINRLEKGTKKLDTIMASAEDMLGRLEASLHTMDDISQRAHAAITEIDVQTAHMEDASSRMVGQIRDTAGQFASQLAGQIDLMRQASAALSAETADFNRSVEYMEANIVGSVRQAVDALTAANEDITSAIEQSSVSSADQIRQQVTELTEIVQYSGSNLTFHLKTVSDDLAAQLERASMDAAQLMEQSRDVMQSMTGELIERVSQSHSELIGFLDQSSAGISGAIDAATYNVAGRLNEAGSQFLANLDQTAGTLLSELGSRTTGRSRRI